MQTATITPIADGRLITVELQTHYGKTSCYPLNRNGGILAELAGTKTLTAQAVKLAAALGYRFRIRHLIGNDEAHTPISAESLADHIDTNR